MALKEDTPWAETCKQNDYKSQDFKGGQTNKTIFGTHALCTWYKIQYIYVGIRVSN